MSKEYKTMRVPVEAYVEAKESKADGETWGDYLRRCTENPPEIREFVEDGSTREQSIDVEDARLLSQHLEQAIAPYFADLVGVDDASEIRGELDATPVTLEATEYQKIADELESRLR